MGTSSKSITQHPLFPALVTMWFGATFGLCSLVIGRPTLEAWVVATGLPQYVSAAQPPLGSTARVLVALAACGIGALLGLALSAMLVRAKAPAKQVVTEADRSDQDPGEEEAVPLPAPDTVDPVERKEETPATPEAIDEADEEEEPAPDALAPFLRDDSGAGHAPRAPFSVFDELGPEAGIAPTVDDDAGETEAPDTHIAGPHPIADILPVDEPFAEDEAPEAAVEPEIVEEPETEPDTAPPFAGSPPLPSNVHPIDPARMAQNGLPTRFAKDGETPEQAPVAEAPEAAGKSSAAPVGQPTAARVTDDLSELSYLQLTERLAQAIARNPRAPERLRRKRASTAVSGPGIERLREMHARTAPANEERAPSSDEIRSALSDLRNIGGAA